MRWVGLDSACARCCHVDRLLAGLAGLPGMSGFVSELMVFVGFATDDATAWPSM